MLCMIAEAAKAEREKALKELQTVRDEVTKQLEVDRKKLDTIRGDLIKSEERRVHLEHQMEEVSTRCTLLTSTGAQTL